MIKRGQITFFIVLGFVLLLVFVLLFFISNYTKQIQKTKISEDIFNINPIKDYIKSCLDTTLKEGVLYTGLDEIYLKKYINNHLKSCADMQIFIDQGFSIKEGNIQSDVQITDSLVFVDLNYPLSLIKQQQTTKLNRFSSSLKLIGLYQLNTLETKITTNDRNLELNIPTNVNAQLDNNLVRDISIQIVDSNDDINIFSPVIYNLQPSGTTFEPPLTLELKYEDSNLPLEFDQNNLRILIRQNNSFEWRPLLTDINALTNTLTANISHFSEVGVGSVENEECYEELSNIEITEEGYLKLENSIENLDCATYKLPDPPYCKTTGRIYITDMAVWDDKLYFGTNDHGSCENVGEIYQYRPNTIPEIMNGFDFFKQQGMKYVRYGNNNILVLGLDPTDENNYEFFVYDGLWHRHNILSDPGGHLVDMVYFNEKYYVLTNYGFVIVKNPTDYTGKGTRLNFEAESKVQKQEIGPVKITSLTVWNNLLYLIGAKQMDCNPKEDSDCQIEYLLWKYGGQDSVKEYYMVPYDLNFGISKEFKGYLFVASPNGGLYKTENGENYDLVDFFNDFIPSSDDTSRRITDLEIVNGKLYVAVMVGRFGILGEFNCNDKKMDISSMILESYEIYSSKDGNNWFRKFSKDMFVKNFPDINFPIVNYKDQLFLGITDSFEGEEYLQQFGNIYKSSIEKEGYVISKPYNLGNFSSGTINWVLENSQNSEIKFQIKTAETKEGLAQSMFFGPDKSSNSYFTTSNSFFRPNHIGDLWVQFKMELKINDVSEIPIIKEIHIKRRDMNDAPHQICITKYS